MALSLTILTACGRGNESDRAYHNYTAEPQVHTLTMASPMLFAPIIREAEQLFNRNLYHETGNSFNLELTAYSIEEWELHRQRFNVLQMSGDSFDLFVVDNHPLWHYARNGLLADIYDLIDQDPSVNRDSFYTNILKAFEYQGQLLSIPTSFGFTYVGINSTLPQVFIDRFSLYETISYASLLNLYRDLKNEFPGEFDHLVYVTHGIMRPRTLFEFAINDYMNFATPSVNLINTSFIDFLESFHFATSHFIYNHPSDYIFTPILPQRVTDRRVNNFVFNTLSYILDPWEALFEFDSPPFVNYIPITDGSGRLMIGSSLFNDMTLSIAVGIGADQSLAWEFIKTIVLVVSCDENRIRHFDGSLRHHLMPNNLKSSIATEYFAERAYHAFSHMFELDILFRELRPFAGQGELGMRSQQITNAIMRLERYNAMTVTKRHYLPAAIWPIYEDFMDGVLTPEDTARRLQNIISLWLIE